MVVGLKGEWWNMVMECRTESIDRYYMAKIQGGDNADKKRTAKGVEEEIDENPNENECITFTIPR